MASPPGKFDRGDIKKTIRDAVIVAIAALLAWAVEQWIPQLEQEGVLPAATVALVAAVLSAFRRWVVDTRPENTFNDAAKK